MLEKEPVEEFAKRQPMSEEETKKRMISLIVELITSPWAKSLNQKDTKMIKELIRDLSSSEAATPTSLDFGSKEMLDWAEEDAREEGEDPSRVRNYLGEEERQTFGLEEEQEQE